MAYGGGNITFSNHSEGTANGSAASVFDYCHSLYLHSRILVPLLHAVVTTVGLSINLYMMLVLFRDLRRPSTGSLTRSGSLRGVSWNFQYFLFHIGLCHICMLTTIPVWITQTVFAQGWIFGYAGCKAVKGLITVSHCFVPLFFSTRIHRLCNQPCALLCRCLFNSSACSTAYLPRFTSTRKGS